MGGKWVIGSPGGAPKRPKVEARPSASETAMTPRVLLGEFSRSARPKGPESILHGLPLLDE